LTNQLQTLCLATMVGLQSVSSFSEQPKDTTSTLKISLAERAPDGAARPVACDDFEKQKDGTWVNSKPMLVDGYPAFKPINFRPGELTNGIDVASFIDSLCKP
jgi:hypothetical protein